MQTATGPAPPASLSYVASQLLELELGTNQQRWCLCPSRFCVQSNSCGESFRRRGQRNTLNLPACFPEGSLGSLLGLPCLTAGTDLAASSAPASLLPRPASLPPFLPPSGRLLSPPAGGPLPSAHCHPFFQQTRHSVLPSCPNMSVSLWSHCELPGGSVLSLPGKQDRVLGLYPYLPMLVPTFCSTVV